MPGEGPQLTLGLVQGFSNWHTHIFNHNTSSPGGKPRTFLFSSVTGSHMWIQWLWELYLPCSWSVITLVKKGEKLDQTEVLAANNGPMKQYSVKYHKSPKVFTAWTQNRLLTSTQHGLRTDYLLPKGTHLATENSKTYSSKVPSSLADSMILTSNLLSCQTSLPPFPLSPRIPHLNCSWKK